MGPSQNNSSKSNNPKKQELQKWFDKHGIEPIHPRAILTAFTHPSYKGIDPDVEDYERYEFLGDSVLDLIVAENLLKNYPAEPEGILTEKRSRLVSNEHLSKIFKHLDITNFVKSAVNYSISLKDKANFVEALFGAYYLHNSIEYCKELWRIIQKKVQGEKEKRAINAPAQPLSMKDKKESKNYLDYYKKLEISHKNAKSVLQELCQKQGLDLPKYQVIERAGPDHNPIFLVKVSCTVFPGPPKQVEQAIGRAKSKRLAEIRAAEKICDTIYLEYNPMTG